MVATQVQALIDDVEMLAVQERCREPVKGDPNPEGRIPCITEVPHGSNHDQGNPGGGDDGEPGRGHHSRPEPSARHSRSPKHNHVGGRKRRGEDQEREASLQG